MKQNGKHTDSRIWGALGSGILHALLLLLMFFYFFDIPEVEDEEEGLCVNYGTSDNGDGLFEPAPESAVADQLVDAQPEPTPAVSTPPPTPSAPTELETQTLEESLAIQEAKKKKQEEEAKRQQELAAQRAAEEAKRKAEAERLAAEEAKRKAQAEAAAKAAAATKNAFSGSGSGGLGSSTTSTGQGSTGIAGNQGNPFGDPNSSSLTGSGTGTGGNGYSLKGRTISGKLPIPTYTKNEEGKVVVTIEVDTAGNVVSAKAGAQGTTLFDSDLWAAAVAAAKKAKFNGITGTGVQTGTITYIFKLN